MSNENTKKNESLDNIKSLDNFVETVVKPFQKKLKDKHTVITDILGKIEEKRNNIIAKAAAENAVNNEQVKETVEEKVPTPESIKETVSSVEEKVNAAVLNIEKEQKKEEKLEIKEEPVKVENKAENTDVKVTAEAPQKVERDNRAYNRPNEGYNAERRYNNNRNDNNTDRPQYNRDNRNEGGYYNRNNQGGQSTGYNRYNNQGGTQGGYNNQQGGYNRNNQGGYNNQQSGGYYNRNNQGGYNNQQGGYNRNNQGGYNNQQGGYNNQQGGYNRNFNRSNDQRPPFNKDRDGTPSTTYGQRKDPKKNSFNTIIAPAINTKDTKIKDKKKIENKTNYDESKAPKKVRAKGVVEDFDPNLINYDDDANITAKHIKLRKAKKQTFTPTFVKIENAVINTENVTIKTLSEKIGKSATEIIKQLFLLNITKTINESIDFDTASLVSDALGIKLELKLDKTFEDKLEDFMIYDEDDKGVDSPRPPIVTIMGHVDHGKTSLLDYIRKSRVAQSEAGGITQHIGAYTISINNKPITFLDTPGHEAFTTMRSRGAQVTDIAVIVVAADDGVMPQTIEAINHAKAAKVSIIIAINKMDKPNADPERIKQQLTEYGIIPEEWGGDNIFVPLSAKTGENVDKLLESILLVAEVLDLKANSDCSAKGTIIESKLDKSKGPVATVLVQNGTLKVFDYVVAGTYIGRIRAMIDDKGRNIKSAGPSIPVSVIGFTEVPNAGDKLVVTKDEKLAKQVAEERKIKGKTNDENLTNTNSLDEIFNKISEGQLKDLNLIIKTDVQGSLEALKTEAGKIVSDEVKVNIVHGGVGAINESDVMLASTSHSIIIGFNVRPDTNASALAEKNKIDIRIYRIIYDVINDVQLALKGMLAPKFKETVTGHAQVRSTFKITGVGTVAGSYVTDGKIARSNKVRLLRDNVIVFEGAISSLKRFKDDAKEVAQGFECGISLEGFNDVKQNDVIEAYIIEEIKL